MVDTGKDTGHIRKNKQSVRRKKGMKMRKPIGLDVCDMDRSDFILLHVIIQFSSKPSIEETILSTLSILGSLVK